jgi:hypothetical protein
MKTTAFKAFVALAGVSFLPRPTVAQAGFTTLYNFTNGYPTGLTLANGGLYGAFLGGEPGGYGCGNIFFLQPPGASGGAWTEKILYTFADTNDACGPEFGPIIGPGGVLYGVTQGGGANYAGALYELKPPASPGGPWTESVLYNFDAGLDTPVSAIVPGPGGSFYGVNDQGLFQLQRPTTSGASWAGVLLESIPDGPLSITPGTDGSLYVTTLYGATSKGAILQLIPPASPGGDWTQTVIHNLAELGQGGYPNSLALGSDGTLYGTTYGSTFFGEAAATVFELTPPASAGGEWTYTKLGNFGSAHQLDQPLILRGGRLYDAFVGSESGAVFVMTPPSASGDAWKLNFLHDFADQATGFSIVDGTQVMDADGTIYGATGVYAYGGPSPTGTVYRIVP